MGGGGHRRRYSHDVELLRGVSVQNMLADILFRCDRRVDGLTVLTDYLNIIMAGLAVEV